MNDDSDSKNLIQVQREDGEELALDGLALARGFFANDPSSLPGGYDSLAGKGDPDRIVIEDVIAMNTTMRSRSPHQAWEPVLSEEQGWLGRIPAALDLVSADEAEWAAANGDALVSDAITGCIRPGIGLAGATKVLFLKRPNLVPILDRFVAEMMGVNPPEDVSLARRISVGKRLITAIRREARRNLEVLESIQAELEKRELRRSLIRIFDAVIWFSHPAASVPDTQRRLAVRLRS